MAAVRVRVAPSRELRSSLIRARVQGRSPIPAPERLTTASAPFSAVSSIRPAAGIPLELGRATRAARLTSVTTSCPSLRRALERAVPISPEAPAIRIRMIHLTMPGTAAKPPGP